MNENLEVSLQVHVPAWHTVFRIPRGAFLIKGRHGMYDELVAAAGSVRDQFGCYAWASPGVINYIGSFSRDYARGGHASNLAARVHNYLQNHRELENGRKNTNLMVFEKLNAALVTEDVSLSVFRFESANLGGGPMSFAAYTSDGQIVRAMEQLLICSCKRIGQCAWNRD